MAMNESTDNTQTIGKNLFSDANSNLFSIKHSKKKKDNNESGDKCQQCCNENTDIDNKTLGSYYLLQTPVLVEFRAFIKQTGVRVRKASRMTS